MVKKVRMTMFCLRVPSDLIVYASQQRCGWPCFVSRAIGVNCLLMAKRLWMPCFVSACHRTSLSPDGKDGADDCVCLHVPTDLIVSWWQKGCGWPCFVSAWCWTWLSLDGKKGANDHVLSLWAIGLYCLWMAKKVWMTMFYLRVPSDLILSR